MSLHPPILSCKQGHLCWLLPSSTATTSPRNEKRSNQNLADAVLDTKPAYTSVTSPSINLLLIGLGRTWLPLGNRNGTGVVHFLLIASVLWNISKTKKKGVHWTLVDRVHDGVSSSNQVRYHCKMHEQERNKNLPTLLIICALVEHGTCTW